MIFEYIRLGFAMAFLVAGIFVIFTAVFGIYKFNNALCRMHSAALCDTLGMLFVMIGLIILSGFTAVSLKMLCVILFMWLTSPVSSHLLSKLECITNGSIQVNPGKEAD